MLAELSERDARGEIAVIYGEIRRLWAVPYVSSLQRHLATRPGWLPWVWASVGPAFASGRGQTAAWQAVERVEVPHLPPIARDALRVWGVDAAGEAAVGAACASFVRVSPVNLVLAGLLRRLLRGERPAGPAPADVPWTPPPALPALPALADVAALEPAARGVLLSLGTAVGGERFVPGLYRLLAGWPSFLAHVATVLPPALADPAAQAALRAVNETVDAVVPAVFATLPSLAARPPAPPEAEFAGVLAALDTYRETSPEMVVAARMIGRALPARGD
jgi:hypothetical protein